MRIRHVVVNEVRFICDAPAEMAPDDVWRCLGPAGGAKGGLAEEVEDAAREAMRLGSPRVCARSLGVVEAARRRVLFEDGVATEGRMLPHLFEGARGGVFLLATAGPALERRVAELFAEGSEVEAFVLDAAASAVAMGAYAFAIDRAAELLHVGGYLTGPCLVPGSDYWPLEGQRAVFEVLPAAELGVELSVSMLMVPQKSLSALIPYGEELRIPDDPRAAPCRRCRAVRCPLRSEEFVGGLTG